MEENMNPAVSLALTNKAKLMFEHGSAYLSFPTTGISYKKGDLDFASGSLTSDRLQVLTEFSHIMDCIPNGIALDLTRPTTLSEAYQDVLRGTTNGVKLAIATRARTSEEEAAYQKAFQFLYTVDADGFLNDSPFTTTYKQYRDTWFTAQEAYKNKEIEAQFTNDPAVKEHWETVGKPALRNTIAEIESDWGIKGYRVAYDSARRIYDQFVGSSSSGIWDQWVKQCMPGLDNLTDAASGQEFFPCGFSPSNILDSPAWTTLTLTEHEVEGLAQAAPPEIRKLFGTDQLDLDIESLSLEVSSVLITRAWFSPEVFSARFWKFYDSGKVLSNGQTPPSGDCPAYVAAVVFARNLIIKLRPQSARNDQTMNLLKASSALSLGTFRLAASPTTSSQGKSVMMRSLAPASAEIRMTKLPMAIGAPRKAPAPGSAQLAKARVVDAEPDQLALSAIDRSGIAFRRMQGKDFRALPVDDVTLPPPPPPPPAPTSEVQIPFDKDEVWILGAICKPFPLCPNPDPTLKWE
jgi:hypothetical protein